LVFGGRRCGWDAGLHGTAPRLPRRRDVSAGEGLMSKSEDLQHLAAAQRQIALRRAASRCCAAFTRRRREASSR